MAATWNPVDKHADIALSNGDLTAKNTVNGHRCARTTFSKSSGKWYWEITIDACTNSVAIGLGIATASLSTALGAGTNDFAYRDDGQKRTNNSNAAFGDSWTTNDIIGIALDRDAGKLWFSKNGVWQASGDPAAGTNEAFSGVSGTEFGMLSIYWANDQITANFGASVFSYSIPSGFSGIDEPPDIEVTLPSPILATTEMQSNIQIELVVPAFTAQSELSVGEIFWGSFVECPSPFEVTTSLHAKTGLEIAINPLIAQTNLQSNIQIELVVPAFTAQIELSVGEIFWGYEIDLPESFSVDVSLQANTQIEIVTVPLIATSALLSNIGIEVSAGVLNNTGAILGTPIYPIILTGSKQIYLFTLTGADDGVDDIVIPIKSFQSRLKSGDPTYLSVVIPGTDYASAINLRLNGDLVVRMGYLSDGEIILSEIISIVDFENIIIYDGTINKTITLDGHRTETFTPKEINLTGSSYKNITAGKLRYRCTPNLYVRPGDTVNIDDDSFTIENITYSVSPELETFEVSE